MAQTHQEWFSEVRSVNVTSAMSLAALSSLRARSAATLLQVSAPSSRPRAEGAMSEAELHVLRARLNGGIRNKAARGELRRGLPVGFVWGEADGEVRFHPDEAVVAAIRNVFARFAQTG